jgi:hypothetical protein
MVRIRRNKTVLQKPVLETALKLAAQGKSKAISTSKTKKRIPTM